MSEEAIIYKLSDWQIAVLSNYFSHTYLPDRNRIDIDNIMLVKDGDVIIDFVQYCKLRREIIPREPNQPKK